MSRKDRVKRITDEQYFAYIAGLEEDDAALFDANGDMLIPEAFTHDERE